MKYLITGGAGFIGCHLAEALLDREEEVFIVDDLSTGCIVNIESLKPRNGFDYAIDSVMNKPLMAEIVDSIDIVFHMAAAVGVKLIVKSPTRTIETNIKGSELVLELAAKKNRKVILGSTSEVYGKSDDLPFNENGDLVLGPPYKGRWSYACSKAIDEFLALAYWREKGLPVVIARMFNIVGPRQTGAYGMVLPSFIGQALSGEAITVYGDGEQTRSFTWVGDAVDALIKLAHCPRAVGEIFNIGSQNETSINDLAALVKKITESKSEIVHIPYDEAYEQGFEDLMRRVPDTSKLRDFIGYEPTMGIRKIIEIMIGVEEAVAAVA